MLFTTATSIESWPRVEKIRSMMKKLIVRTFRETWRMRSVYPIASTKRRRAYKRFLSRIIPHRVHIPTTLPAHVIELRAPTAITMLLGTTVLLILGRRVTSISLSLSLSCSNKFRDFNCIFVPNSRVHPPGLHLDTRTRHGSEIVCSNVHLESIFFQSSRNRISFREMFFLPDMIRSILKIIRNNFDKLVWEK